MKDKRKIGFTYAWNGIRDIYKNEFNFRIHLVAAFVVIVFSFFLQVSKTEWIFVLFAIGLVLVVEIINSVVERMVDYLKPEFHPQAKYIKDAAAGAVLVTAFFAALIGVIIFLPKIYNFFNIVLR